MARVLSAGVQKVGIADYMAVFPFAFNSQGCLTLRPKGTRVVVNMVSAQAAGSGEWHSRLADARGASDLQIQDDEERVILSMNDFRFMRVSMMASLDMTIARLVLGGAGSGDTWMYFDPLEFSFDEFPKSEDGRGVWGAEILSGGKELLRASLSVPTYAPSSKSFRDPSSVFYVNEYAALGPANSHGASDKGEKSVFQWLIGQGLPMQLRTGTTREFVPKTATDPFAGFTVKDLISGRFNQFGGESAKAQLKSTKGAVFVVNGDWLLNHTPWRELLGTVRIVAEAGIRDDPRASVGQLLDSFPAASDFDQTVSQTTREVHLENYGVETPEYEGILLWDLDNTGTGESGDFMHG